MLAGPRAL